MLTSSHRLDHAGWIIPWLLIGACTAAPEGSAKPNTFGTAGAASAGGSVVPAGAALCGTCETSTDCGALYDLCIVHASTRESFCGVQCGDQRACPSGFSCVAFPGAPRNQCVPDSGTCQWKPEVPDGSGGAGGGAGGSATGGSGGSGGTGGAGDPCGGDCATRRLTDCTCGQADPCGWVGDSWCDEACYAVAPSDHFDDSVDCATTGGAGGGTTAPCGGECGEGSYTACTCDVSDPCAWAADGYCDDACYNLHPTNHFDDSSDCNGPNGNDCGGDCTNGYLTECSCSYSDPCGWSGDGYCDAQCYDMYPNDHFSDWSDCGY